MAIAASLGALASRTGDRRFRILVVAIAVLALPLPSPDGGLGAHRGRPHRATAIDRVRRLRPSLALFGVLAAVTAVLTSFGPAAVDATADLRALPVTPAPVSVRTGSASRHSHGVHVRGCTPRAPTGDGAGLPPRACFGRSAPVIVFLHDLPGDSNDWLAGAATPRSANNGTGERCSRGPWPCSRRSTASSTPPPRWSDVPGQRTLASAVHDSPRRWLASFLIASTRPRSRSSVSAGAPTALRCRDDRSRVATSSPSTPRRVEWAVRPSCRVAGTHAGGGWQRWRLEPQARCKWPGSQAVRRDSTRPGTRT